MQDQESTTICQPWGLVWHNNNIGRQDCLNKGQYKMVGMKMSFEILQKSPEVAPLLVRLYDTHNLYTLAEDKGSTDSRFELTTIMVDLLRIKLSEKESELITDVLFALMKQAEIDLRASLAEKLSTFDDVPLRMVLSLANDDIRVADSVLRKSPVLQDMDLIYILQAKGAEHGRSISLREGLSPPLIDMLVDTGDLGIAMNLSGNDGVMLTDHAYRVFMNMARNNASLAKPLSLRDDLSPELAAALYEFVGDELKNLLRSRFSADAAIPSQLIDDVIAEVRAPESRTIAEQDRLMHMATAQHQRGELKISALIANLRRGLHATFTAQFAVFCSLPISTVKAMIKQETGRGLAITCRAMDLQKADFVSIYLLTERIRSGGRRVVGPQELTRLMVMFEEINPEEARHTIRNSRH